LQYNQSSWYKTQESLVHTYTVKTRPVPEHQFVASDAGQSQ